MPANNPDPSLENLGDPLAGTAETDPHSIIALDEAFSKLAKEKGHTEPIPGLTIEPKADDAKAEADKKAADEKAAAEKKVADEKAAAAAPPQTPEEKAAAEKKVADEKAAAEKKVADEKAANDLYSDVQLPQNARGASAQAFATIKARAAADLADRDKKLQAAQAELTKLQEQAKGVVPAKELETTRKELEDLRKWKASLDVEADPSLKAPFEAKVNTANEFIYSKLLGTGKLTAEHIESIKKLGGPENVEWTPIFTKLADPQLQRLIQSKLDEIETVKFEKQQAVEKAKKNVDDYLAGRAKEFEGAAQGHNEHTKRVLVDLLGKVPWMVPPQLKADATDADKKAAEGSKAFIDDVNKVMSDSLNDDSPEMRAVLLMGVAQHLNLKRVHASTVAEKDGLAKKLADTEKSLTEANAQIEKFKKGSVTRLRDSNAPVGDGKPPAEKADPFKDTAADALEKFRASRAP